MSIKQRLRMYQEPTAQKGPANDESDAIDQESLKLGELTIPPIGSESKNVFLRTLRLSNPLCGTKALADYVPFQISAILELALVPQTDAVHPEDLLFLDTETTGLSRGVGTFPFLTGLAYLRGHDLLIKQYLITSPGEENLYLNHIQQQLEKHPYLVTYNGKSFDIPLLRSRLILQRKILQERIHHFDLFHILRRLFPNRRLASYRQKDLESELLGSVREGDLPGSQVPQIYFDYIKYGTDTGMEKIIEHNMLDLKGMVFLFLESVRIYTERDKKHISARAGLARLLAKNRKYIEALEASHSLGELGDLEGEGFIYRDALFRAWLERKNGHFEAAAESYRTIAETCSCDFSRLSLARILEYRLKRYEDALSQTMLLLEKPSPASDVDSLARRKARLEKIIQRKSS